MEARRRAGEVRRRPDLHGEGEEEGRGGEEEAGSARGEGRSGAGKAMRTAAEVRRASRCGREGGSEQVEAGCV